MASSRNSAATRPRLVAVVLPHAVDVLHVHDSDHVLQDRCHWRGFRRRSVLGVDQCTDSAIEKPSFLFEHFTLLTEDRRQRKGMAIEQLPDLVERKANRFEREDLLETNEVRRPVEAIAGRRPARSFRTAVDCESLT